MVSQIDLEEIRPNVFLVRNAGVRPIIKREGELDGKLFRLTSWRREGMLARLALQGFAVLTLEDYVAGLPELPDVAHVPPDTPTASLRISRTDRYSRFEPRLRDWEPLTPPAPSTPDQPLQLQVAPGWIIRRRQGRGRSSYAQVQAKGQLRPLDELNALLYGYAYAALLRLPPVTIQHDPTAAQWLLPALPLPAPHRELLAKIATPAPANHALVPHGWLGAADGLALAEAVLASLGLAVQVVQVTPHS